MCAPPQPPTPTHLTPPHHTPTPRREATGPAPVPKTPPKPKPKPDAPSPQAYRHPIQPHAPTHTPLLRPGRWGVGLLTFIMLYGFNPFAREVQHETHNAIVKAAYTFPEGYSCSTAAQVSTRPTPRRPPQPHPRPINTGRPTCRLTGLTACRPPGGPSIHSAALLPRRTSWAVCCNSRPRTGSARRRRSRTAGSPPTRRHRRAYCSRPRSARGMLIASAPTCPREPQRPFGRGSASPALVPGAAPSPERRRHGMRPAHTCRPPQYGGGWRPCHGAVPFKQQASREDFAVRVQRATDARQDDQGRAPPLVQ